MSQCICSICSNRGPDIVYPILPKHLFAQYLQKVDVSSKSGFITSNFREYVHFRCAIFLPQLKWVKELLQRSHLDYVCFGLEWIQSSRDKEEMCAVCQKGYRQKVLLNCQGKENGPCGKRYHADCVIAVRKRIYYKTGKIILLCNEHFSEGKLDPENRILDWLKIEDVVKEYIEFNILRQEQDQQNYIASIAPKTHEGSNLRNSIQSKQQFQKQKPFLIKQKMASKVRPQEKEDLSNQYQYIFRPRELFQIDYSCKNPPIADQPSKRQKHGHDNGNGFGRKHQTIQSSDGTPVPAEMKRNIIAANTNLGLQNRYKNDTSQLALEQKIYAKQAEQFKNAIVIQEEQEEVKFLNQLPAQKSVYSSSLNPPSVQQQAVQKVEDKRAFNMLEDNDEGINIFSLYETKKNKPLNNSFKTQIVQDPPREQLTKPQMQQLERLKLKQAREIKPSSIQMDNCKIIESQKTEDQQSESQNKIKQLQQDLEEAHGETNETQCLVGRQQNMLQSQQQQQSIITPKIRLKRQILNQTAEDETSQQHYQKAILPKTNYRIEVLSQLVPIYPYEEEEEKQWESVNAWWSKIDEFYFQKQEVQADFQDQVDAEITIQPTVELLKKTYLSVLVQGQSLNYIVHYELDPIFFDKENGNGGCNKQNVSSLNIFDRTMKQIESFEGCRERCGLKFVEALELNEQEVRDCVKLQKSIVSSQQNSELDIMYSHLMKEFEELSDSNSANLRKLQGKSSQQQNQSGELLTIIQEGVSLIDQLRWNEVSPILRCFEVGFKNKNSSVLQQFNFTTNDRQEKLLQIYELQNQTYHLETNCQVCFSGKIMQLNPIVYCDECFASFHQYCYGISEDDLINSNSFKCDKCRVPSKKNCYICKKRHSPLPLKQIQNYYYHPTCIVLFEYLSVSRPLQLARGVFSGQIDLATDSSIECSLCLKKKGRKIRCKECEKQYHILCAYLNGFEISIRSDWRRKQKVAVEITCGVHTISLQKLIKQIFYRRFSINYDDAANYESSDGYYEEKLKMDIEFKQVKRIFECESFELLPRKQLKITSDLF